MDIHDIRFRYARWVQRTQPDAEQKLFAFWLECRQHDWELFVQLEWIVLVTVGVVLAELLVLR